LRRPVGRGRGEPIGEQAERPPVPPASNPSRSGPSRRCHRYGVHSGAPGNWKPRGYGAEDPLPESAPRGRHSGSGVESGFKDSVKTRSSGQWSWGDGKAYRRPHWLARVMTPAPPTRGRRVVRHR
jgi:hypothetical protein